MNCYKRSFGKFLRNDHGATAVEFTLLMPLFVTIMLGGIDLGRYIFLQNELTAAVQDAGRFAMVRGSSSKAPATEAKIIDFASQRLQFNDPDRVTFTVVFNPNNASGSTLTIRAESNFAAAIGLLDLSSLTLDATSVNIMLN